MEYGLFFVQINNDNKNKKFIRNQLIITFKEVGGVGEPLAVPEL